MSYPFTPFTPENGELVVEALNFTKKVILDYHENWRMNSHQMNWADIDKMRSRYDKILNDAIKTVEPSPYSDAKLYRREDIEKINEIIASSLRIYGEEYEKAIDPKIPGTRKKLQQVGQLLNGARFASSNSHRWDEFYEGYQQPLKKSGKLIFFSYNNRDMKDVGKIADRLHNKYGYEVFRAHDKESIDNDEDWRIKIRENLENCDLLVAYVNRNFRGSAWTHQECGWVMARGIPIYSLIFMKKIPGLLEAKQGTKLKPPLDYGKVAQDIHDFFLRHYLKKQT